MKADILNLRQLFQKDVRYVVPTFQRPYVWNQDDQWEPLWEDVRNVAERYLDQLAKTGEGGAARAEQNTGSHFLGAVVVQQRPFAASEIETRHVIDGQQRLTTLQLLLDAAQEVLEAHEYLEGRRLTRYVLNHEDLTSGDHSLRFKVWPSSADQDAFCRAMENGAPTDGFEGSAIVQAHEFFQLQVEQWLVDGENASQRAHALEAALVGLLELVVIDIDPDDDSNVIFETLNARGTPLLASDLIKNLVLLTAESEGIDPEHLSTDQWSEFDQSWWREEVRQGRIVRPRIDTYLNYWLVTRTQRDVLASDVFPSFRRYLETASSVSDIVVDIRATADVYSRLQGIEEDAELSEFLYRWRVMDIRVLTPVLLWLLGQHDPGDDGLKQTLRTLESYLVRRMLCRMTSQDYNRLFLDLLARLAAAPPHEAHDLSSDLLTRQTAEARLWPDDARLRAAIEDLPLYRLLTRGRLRFVLEAIEDDLRSPKAEYPNAPRGSLTIEHVMPQGWHANWPLKVSDSRAEAIARRDHLVHTMGNLTLVTRRLNPSLSNARWRTKKTKLAKHSRLELNLELAELENKKWDEAAILQRSRLLGDRVVALWPHPTST